MGLKVAFFYMLIFFMLLFMNGVSHDCVSMFFFTWFWIRLFILIDPEPEIWKEEKINNFVLKIYLKNSLVKCEAHFTIKQNLTFKINFSTHFVIFSFRWKQEIGLLRAEEIRFFICFISVGSNCWNYYFVL